VTQRPGLHGRKFLIDAVHVNMDFRVREVPVYLSRPAGGAPQVPSPCECEATFWSTFSLAGRRRLLGVFRLFLFSFVAHLCTSIFLTHSFSSASCAAISCRNVA